MPGRLPKVGKYEYKVRIQSTNPDSRLQSDPSSIIQVCSEGPPVLPKKTSPRIAESGCVQSLLAIIIYSPALPFNQGNAGHLGTVHIPIPPFRLNPSQSPLTSTTAQWLPKTIGLEEEKICVGCQPDELLSLYQVTRLSICLRPSLRTRLVAQSTCFLYERTFCVLIVHHGSKLQICFLTVKSKE